MTQNKSGKATKRGMLIGGIVSLVAFQIAAPFVFGVPEDQLNYVRIAAAAVAGVAGAGIGALLGSRVGKAE